MAWLRDPKLSDNAIAFTSHVQRLDLPRSAQVSKRPTTFKQPLTAKPSVFGWSAWRGISWGAGHQKTSKKLVFMTPTWHPPMDLNWEALRKNEESIYIFVQRWVDRRREYWILSWLRLKRRQEYHYADWHQDRPLIADKKNIKAMHGSDDWPRCYYSLSTVLNHNNNNHNRSWRGEREGMRKKGETSKHAPGESSAQWLKGANSAWNASTERWVSHEAVSSASRNLWRSPRAGESSTGSWSRAVGPVGILKCWNVARSRSCGRCCLNMWKSGAPLIWKKSPRCSQGHLQDESHRLVQASVAIENAPEWPVRNHFSQRT